MEVKLNADVLEHAELKVIPLHIAQTKQKCEYLSLPCSWHKKAELPKKLRQKWMVV